MRLAILLLLCTGWLPALPAGAQTAARPARPLTWARTYGAPSPGEGLFDLRRVTDGSLRVAGFGGSSASTSAAGWLLELDPGDGGVRGERAVGRSSPSGAGGADGAALAADGGAMFMGRDVLDLFTKHDAWVVRVDAAGNLAWSRGFTRPGFGRHFLFDAAELGDGSWIAGGAVSEVDMPPQAGWVVRLASDGALLWQFEFGAGTTESFDSVRPTSDGGFVLAGATNSSGAGSDDAWVLKIDASGRIEWQWTFGGVEADRASDVVELSTGGYAIAGSTDSFTASRHAPWVLRLAADGSLLWHAVVAGGAWGDLQAVAETHDGQVVAFGRAYEPGHSTNDLWAVELAAADGSLRWQRAYAGDSGDWGSELLALPDGCLVLGGVWGWGFPVEDLFVLRTAAGGRLAGCALDRATDFAITSPGLAAQPGVAVRSAAGALPQAVGFELLPSQADGQDRCR